MIYRLSYALVSISNLVAAPQELIENFAFLGGQICAHGQSCHGQIMEHGFHVFVTSSYRFENLFCPLSRTGVTLTADYEQSLTKYGKVCDIFVFLRWTSVRVRERSDENGIMYTNRRQRAFLF